MSFLKKHLNNEHKILFGYMFNTYIKTSMVVIITITLSNESDLDFNVAQCPFSVKKISSFCDEDF